MTLYRSVLFFENVNFLSLSICLTWILNLLLGEILSILEYRFRFVSEHVLVASERGHVLNLVASQIYSILVCFTCLVGSQFHCWIKRRLLPINLAIYRYLDYLLTSPSVEQFPKKQLWMQLMKTWDWSPNDARLPSGAAARVKIRMTNTGPTANGWLWRRRRRGLDPPLLSIFHRGRADRSSPAVDSIDMLRLTAVVCFTATPTSTAIATQAYPVGLHVRLQFNQETGKLIKWKESEKRIYIYIYTADKR